MALEAEEQMTLPRGSSMAGVSGDAASAAQREGRGGMGTRFCSPRLQCWQFWGDPALAAGCSLYSSQ